MLTFSQCVELISHGRRDRKKLENNTYLQMTTTDAWHRPMDAFAVRLHSTNVVIILPDDTWQLNSGGWYTPTTKNRINEYGPASVRSKDGNWVLSHRHYGEICPADDPLELLVEELRLDGKPSLPWVIKWDQGGDPVSNAWAASNSYKAMLSLLVQRPRLLAKAKAELDAEVLKDGPNYCQAIRRAVPPPTMDTLPKAFTRGCHYVPEEVYPFYDGIRVGRDGRPFPQKPLKR